MIVETLSDAHVTASLSPGRWRARRPPRLPKDGPAKAAPLAPPNVSLWDDVDGAFGHDDEKEATLMWGSATGDPREREADGSAPASGDPVRHVVDAFARMRL